ncbi:hypothetical protein NA2_01814 [Nitratireductor pacificus pht-3B]|uniref:Uncharacterized protein n=2 Tax=Nitratireductor TaxID=245876 RepID=K2ME73_9HYPH|nr:hypothetical protein NA2_01814 [Nitratireductor pacificus pht-3B]
MWVVLIAGNGHSNAQDAVNLHAYADKYPWDEVGDVSFLQNPAVKSAVAGALIDANLRQMILDDTASGRAVTAPMVAVGDYLYMRAFEAASGGDVSWGLLIAQDGSDAVACFSGFGAGETQKDDRPEETVRSSWYADGEVFLTRKFSCPANDEIQDEVGYRVLPALATARGKLQYEWCFGVLNTGSGLAGSMISGDGACFIQADSEAQALVKHSCGEGDLCLIEAMIEIAEDDDRKLIREVLSVNRAVEQVEPHGSYLEQVGSFADGVYAEKIDGCGAASMPGRERVSMHLSRTAGPAIQFGQRYCAVIDATGDAPNPEGFQTVLQVRCGNGPDEDAALRSGAAGKADVLQLRASSAREVSLQETSLLRCPIRSSYAPEWWMSDLPTNVRSVQF